MKCLICGGDCGSPNSLLACHCPPGLCSPQNADPKAAYEAWLAEHRGNEGPPRSRCYSAADSRREFSWLYTESHR